MTEYFKSINAKFENIINDNMTLDHNHDNS